MDAIKATSPYAFVGGPFGSNLTTRDYVDEGVPVIRGNNLPADSMFHDNDYVFISEKKADTLRSNTAFPGDLVFTQRGTLGQVGLIPREAKHQRYIISQSQMKLTVDPEIADPRFVYYFFRLPATVTSVINHALTSGVPHINLGILKDFNIFLPGPDIQSRIADILSAYDDLVENNRRRMALLEETARQLYREWFVRLRFPGYEHTRITNGVPEGWVRKTLGSVAEVRSGFAFQSNTYLESGKFGIVTIKNVHDGNFVPEVASFLEDLPEKMPAHCKLVTGDIVLSLTGNIGRTCLVVGDNYLLNQRVAKLIPYQGSSRSFTYFTFRESSVQKRIVSIAYGVAQQNLSPVKMGDLPFILPPLKIIRRFDDFAERVIDQLVLLKLQNQQLRQARDLLLPRLMSGEIAV